ncbi:MAG: hypothetical protein Q8S36_10035 [Sulfuricurvum sp.]|nr:hypothetical protein [Sulfuricurvum sp.]
MKTLTIKIEDRFYNEIKKTSPKNMKITYFYIELLKIGLKNKGLVNELSLSF